ncbi:UEV-domain-containing protein [Tilletiaria anomala UBC 951]|uniref:UEV-domain-containing protein n=1 Tax=Tilletiaria anomala (strain ATCC 24038 / CBS 436.72 / UBC 951) TaxID=1037660 RepID=A0A066VQN8_TILAU|nr:UEV-domain-containing protein [Tilletiaria anomala UBC 951]KDN44062.1 UEV-domain-containing protein [Tilletiaria anomala UBC 951]
MDHTVVRQWLHSVLGKYSLSDRVFTHVDALLLAYSSLTPRTEVYTYDDGRTALLLRISGTIPISYRSSTYHIPIAMWLPHAYPREPPLAYVEPVKGMAIRKGHKHVQLDGYVVTPAREFEEERHKSYLRRWERKWEACNLVELVQFLQSVFGHEPPVYSAANGSGSASATAGSSRQDAEFERGSTSINGISGLGHRPPPAPPGALGLSSSSAARDPPNRPPKPRQPADVLGRSSSLRSSSSGSAYSPSGPTRMGVSEQASPGLSHAKVTHQAWQSSITHLMAGSSQHLHPHQQQQSVTLPSHVLHNAPQYYSNQHHQFSPNHSQDRGASRRGWSMPPPARERSVDSSMGYSPLSPPAQPPLFALSHHPHASTQQTNPSQAFLAQPTSPPRPPSMGHPYGMPTSSSLNLSLSAAAPPHLPQGSNFAPQLPPSKPPLPRDLLGVEDDTEASASVQSYPSSSGAPGEPPPILPPNPEILSLHNALHQKLSARVSSISAHFAQQSQRMAVLSSDLDRGEAAIHDEIARLEAVKEVCKGRAERMAAFVEEARQGLQAMEAKVEDELEQPGSGNDWICATSIVGNQLIDLVAEDNAIEDTLYHLGRALNSERITLDAFLKQTRFLAREQFMRRALAIRICNSVGWN